MWPWRRRRSEAAEYAARAERDALARLRRAHGASEAIDRRAAELARELPAGELYLRLAAALARNPLRGDR